MRADQRKAVVMVANGGNLDIPTLDTMAVLAIRPELAAVQVGVTLGAARRRFRKYQAHMATGAGYILMEAQQCELGLRVVVELGLPANGLPCRGRMAVLAGKIERAMRIGNTSTNRILPERYRSKSSEQKY
jgi:hypothetical protein